MKRILKKIFLVSLVIFLGSTYFSSSVFAMEAAVGEAAERAFAEELGETGLEGLEESGALKEATDSIVNEMKVNAEGFNSLPPEAKAEFKTELIEAFREGGFENYFKGGKFEAGGRFSDLIGSAKEGFNESLTEMGERSGYSPLEGEGLNKFDPKFNVEEFPVKTSDEIAAFDVDREAGFNAGEKKLNPSEQKVAGAQKDLASAERDVKYLEETGASEQDLSAARAKVRSAKTTVDASRDTYLNNLKENADNLYESVKKLGGTVRKKLFGRDVEDLNKLQTAEKDLEGAQGEELKAKRQSAERDYQDAIRAKQGTPGENERIRNAADNQTEAGKNLKEAQAKYKEGDPELKNAQDKFDRAQQEFKDAKRAGGTVDRESIANQNLDELDELEAKGVISKDSPEYKAAEKELSDAVDANKLADQELDKATKARYEAGQGDWRFKLKQRAINTYESLKDQIIMGVIGGFAFSLPNFIIGPIEAAMNAKAQRDTMEKPQFFGNVWMQIPSPLISKAGQPLVAKYLYVAVPGAKSDGPSPKRNHEASTDSYLQHAPMYMSRSEYDVYAEEPIVSPRFPGQMVHLNTGFQFFGEGTGVSDEERIQFLGTPPKDFRGEPLQTHLERQAGDILRGVSSEQYFEEREQTTKYKGSPTIADQFIPDKNDVMKILYPQEAQEGNGYGSLLNNSIQAFASGTYFGPMMVRELSSLSDAAQKELGIASTVHPKPWVAYGQYIYQTADTANVKAVRAILQKDPKTAEIANEIVEYVVMLDEGDKIVPLQMPDAAGNPYGVAGYQRNTQATSMLSLFNMASYNDTDTGKPTGKFGGTVEQWLTKARADELKPQVDAMNAYINEKAQYGSFDIGGKLLEPNKDLIDAGVFVYKIAGALEGGADDYVVATVGFNIVEITQSPTFIISLVTSRIYDDQMIPWDNKHGKRKDSAYIIYKQKDEAAPPLVVVGSKPNPDYGTSISTGLTAPLYSLFMDPDINPNTVDPKAIQNEEDRKWYAQKVGVKEADATYPLAVPDQWAYSDRGPVANPKTGQRIRQLIDQKKTEVPAVNTLNKAVNTAYQAWKKLSPKAVSDDLGPFVFADGNLPHPIVISVTSAQDVANKNFVYTSAYYPDQYLVLSDTPDKSGAKFATQYDIAGSQRYAISLSSGNVYDNQKPAEPITKIDNLDQLLQDVTNKQGKFLPTLLQEVQGSQSINKHKKQEEQYSAEKTWFGPFRLYITEKHLNAGQYVYADMTKFGNPLTMNAKTLQDALNKADYYIGIDKKDGVKDQPELGQNNPAFNSNNWKGYGYQIGPNTVLVLDLITGILYDRGGGYQGYMKEFSAAVSNLNLQTGYLDTIWNLLKATWGTLPDDLKGQIVARTQAEYNNLIKQRDQIADAEKREKDLYAPLGITSNLDYAQYVPLLQKFEPKRYVKKYNDKYYTVIPADPGPKMYIDYNVGEAGKDNGVGMSYDADGNALVRMTGWVLDNARAYAGVVVKPNGSQEIDVAFDHPAIPMESMVELDESKLEKKLADARTTYQKAAQAADAKPGDETLTNALAQASMALGYARLEHQASKVAAQIIKNLKTNYGYAFYFNEDAGTYFISIAGDRYIDLKAGYQFNNDGSPRLRKSPVYANKKDPTNLLLVGQEAYDLFIAVFKIPEKQYYSWTVNDIQKEETKTGFNYHYYVSPPDDLNYSGDVYWYSDQNNYSVYVTPLSTGDLVFTGTYQPDPNKQFSLLRYYRTQGADGGSYIGDDATALSPVFIIWDGKPDLKLQQLYYRNNIINLTGSGDTFTGQYKVDGQTRSITVKKVVKSFGKVGKAHYVTITDGKNTYELLYDTSILNPQLPTSCPDIATLIEQKEEVQKLNYWKQCPNGWNLNVVSDSNGVLRLATGFSGSTLRPLPAPIKAPIIKQAGSRGEILKSNLNLIRVDPATNSYYYQLSSTYDVNQKTNEAWAYYQPQWEGWYVDLATGILYGYNPVDSTRYYPLGSMQLSQLYVLLDKLEVAIAIVPASDGEPLYDNQGKAIVDPKTKQPVLGKPGIVYRGQSVVNKEITDLATTAQKQQAVGK